MSTSLPPNLSPFLSVTPSMSVCLSLSLPVSVSLCHSIYVCLSVTLSLPVSLSPCLSLPVCLSLCHSLPVCLSVSLPPLALLYGVSASNVHINTQCCCWYNNVLYLVDVCAAWFWGVSDNNKINCFTMISFFHYGCVGVHGSKS